MSKSGPTTPRGITGKFRALVKSARIEEAARARGHHVLSYQSLESIDSFLAHSTQKEEPRVHDKRSGPSCCGRGGVTPTSGSHIHRPPSPCRLATHQRPSVPCGLSRPAVQ